MNWEFNLPVKLVFGQGCAENCLQDLKELGTAVLVCDPFLKNKAEAMAGQIPGLVNAIFDDLTPNPDLSEVDRCCALIREKRPSFLIALGGGSAIDLAKAASVISQDQYPARHYHSEGRPLPQKKIPLIAIPTTAGTGSEVTNVSVLSDHEKGIKAPLASPLFFAKMAVIDPLLTLTVPPHTTASTGLDVLAHALEGYWSIHHQPICDAAALQAAKLVFAYLEKAYDHPDNIEAREKMCEASLMAGIAFSHPKTAGSHACSYPLTNHYGLPHGEACAFTLDLFTEINNDARLESLARYCGFLNTLAMTHEIRRLKKYMGMRTSLAEAGIKLEDLDDLVEASMHPNMLNNPVRMDKDQVRALYLRLQ